MKKKSDNVIKTWPTLFHEGKKGAMVQWEVWTKNEMIFTRHGQVGGKLQMTLGVTAEAKNEGKANSTNPIEQAQKEAGAMWKYKVTRKYRETKEETQEGLFLPGLAKDFKIRKGKGIVYPADVQPKLDGVRAMAYWKDDRVILGTRSGKEWTAPSHVNILLEKILPKKMVLDGELYIHEVLFEQLASWTKKVYPETAQLEYHVFDMPLNEKGENLPWKERCENLKQFFIKEQLGFPLVLVQTIRANNSGEVLASEEEYLSRGYEGAMVRNLNSKYLFGYRSDDIQKVKSSQDIELKIVGFKHGKGAYHKSVVWICECLLNDGSISTVDVNPKTTLINREKLYIEAEQHIGEWLKIRFQNYTEDGKPRFLRGLGSRDERDM